ncbi:MULTISPECIES: bifunctional 4-hydroxy-2-oxoglutarate aldolase/2-dehydro-3-deoxy-phosphogluconate aldolase [Micromonospora]|uniref:bifunctional 4-hydroxy-2-oxoglutarate aldolase/2-dehydro-3-deoxy-phosphogluconate aldolase n=1 Tax=Micromonospora TaxID=1873 RepID=UPI001EE800ED|nr:MULTISPECIES: bifunctional 4-hydroxy-2-oxoglutarate aldolase/2-dehydro-3-deoxy-phosphogluconate aldolase [Micromonospora]MCG5450707.1 bifunctional 4-hydroxy-2-oxoglutarate aldolase/2-dehydro-3-deoxy-phosphogluconate aldolase [Micromonospora hortensis]MCX5116215.1 bifunctional 4-hydroxy-2-oxoglutarate aldolase/2-dehydro-3-deoxy-phosphogluconate aldolase [Micromonospora sp. NBC_00362]WTI05509.1 bifunctional 4-hydroxy-2-oxoglutarate aldolase/2-dehydro-3-deoxy-phosphogluconate aldolase [Micromono
MTTPDFDHIFGGARVMAILRGLPVAETVRLAERAWDLGIDVVEVPVATADAVPALRAAVEAGAARDRIVGAGTVLDVDQVAAAADAGARFTVAPGLDLAVADAAAARGLPHLPGVATPTEAQQALRHGLTWLKAFPAISLGPAWFKAVAGPLPQVRFVATGGLDAGNAGAFLQAGVRVVAVGSALSDPTQLDALAKLTRSAL